MSQNHAMSSNTKSQQLSHRTINSHKTPNRKHHN